MPACYGFGGSLHGHLQWTTVSVPTLSGAQHRLAKGRIFSNALRGQLWWTNAATDFEQALLHQLAAVAPAAAKPCPQNVQEASIMKNFG